MRTLDKWGVSVRPDKIAAGRDLRRRHLLGKFRPELIHSLKRPILWVMLLAPYLLCWIYVNTYAVNTPLSDDFTFVLLLKLLSLGQIGLFDVLDAQHNEHRVGLPYLLTLAVARLTHYNTVFNMYLGLVFVGGALAVALYFLWTKI